MKFGINTFVWVSPFSTAALSVLGPKVKGYGYDILELAIEDPRQVDVAKVKAGLREYGLETIICGAFGPDRNICSADPAIRQNAEDYIRWLIDAAAELGSPTVVGPMYSSVGKAHLETAAARQQEWELSIERVRAMADYARPLGVRLALETLNRFETDMINTVAQGMEYIAATGADNLGLHLDTFHLHLEEKSSAAAICMAGDRLFHFHACENDRGVPGSGQVRWAEVAQALKEVGYQGPVVIESFTPEVKEIARAVCIWREIAPSQDAIAEQGLHFLKTLLAC
jgi:D-psicose/D-tagatose/L-ribulose 3-epimerase